MRLVRYVDNYWPFQTLDLCIFFFLFIVKQTLHNRFQHKGYLQVYVVITIEVDLMLAVWYV